jgi:hypothetical protein
VGGMGGWVNDAYRYTGLDTAGVLSGVDLPAWWLFVPVEAACA